MSASHMKTKDPRCGRFGCGDADNAVNHPKKFREEVDHRGWRRDGIIVAFIPNNISVHERKAYPKDPNAARLVRVSDGRDRSLNFVTCTQLR
jgi:hypothetical protein